jgi:hypothetical protein
MLDLQTLHAGCWVLPCLACSARQTCFLRLVSNRQPKPSPFLFVASLRWVLIGRGGFSLSVVESQVRRLYSGGGLFVFAPVFSCTLLLAVLILSCLILMESGH